jgi:hypothetical protein
MLWSLIVAGVTVLLLALHLHHRKVRPASLGALLYLLEY